MERHDISWHLASGVLNELAELKEGLGPSAYADQRQALQDFLCGYVGTDPGCLAKLGKSISPLGSTKNGNKILKVRWGLPGQGKSGGLRLAFVTRCAERVIILAAICQRREDPSTEMFLEAAESADST